MLQQIVQLGPFGMGQPETLTEEVDKLQGEPVLDDLHVEDEFRGIQWFSPEFFLTIGPLDEI